MSAPIPTDPIAFADHMADPAPVSGHDHRAAQERAVLDDPLRFARTMAEYVFYSQFGSVFSAARDDISENWRRAADVLTHAARSGNHQAITEANGILSDLGTDVIGDVIEGIGVPLGVALERIRQTMLASLDAIATHRDGRADRYQRDADRIATVAARLDRAA